MTRLRLLRIVGCCAIAVAIAVADAGASFAGEGAGEATREPGAHQPGAHEEHHIDGKRLALQLFNFAVLALLLGKVGGGAINKALRARHDQVKADMNEASQVLAAARTRFEAQERRLAELEREVAAMRAGMQEEARHERDKIIAAADEKARRIGDETRFAVEQQSKGAELRVRREIAANAIRTAEATLRRAVAPHDEQRLVRGFVEGIAG